MLRRTLCAISTHNILSDLLPSENKNVHLCYSEPVTVSLVWESVLCVGVSDCHNQFTNRLRNDMIKKENDHDKTRLRKTFPSLPGCGYHCRILRHAPHRRYLRPETPAQESGGALRGPPHLLHPQGEDHRLHAQPQLPASPKPLPPRQQIVPPPQAAQ